MHAVYRIVYKIDADEAIRAADAYRKENQLLIQENREKTVRCLSQQCEQQSTSSIDC
jgi:hypothetical protein